MIPNVREATEEDAPWFIAHVRALVSEPGVAVPLRTEEFTTTVEQQAVLFSNAASRGDLYLIAEVEGRRVGELNLRRGTRIAFRHSVVLGMSVAPEWRNRRIGTALMQRALAWAKADPSIRRVELYVYATNKPAIRLYERHGFVIEGMRRGAVCVGDVFVDDLLMVCHVGR